MNSKLSPNLYLWFKFDWEYNMHGDIVRGKDFELISTEKFSRSLSLKQKYHNSHT
jgi:hypothetical protein